MEQTLATGAVWVLIAFGLWLVNFGIKTIHQVITVRAVLHRATHQMFHALSNTDSNAPVIWDQCISLIHQMWPDHAAKNVHPIPIAQFEKVFLERMSKQYHDTPYRNEVTNIIISLCSTVSDRFDTLKLNHDPQVSPHYWLSSLKRARPPVTSKQF